MAAIRAAPLLYSHHQLARLVGVSAKAIDDCAQNGSLAAACIGKRVDLNHPAARAYLDTRGVAVPGPLEPPPAPGRPHVPIAAPGAPTAPRKLRGRPPNRKGPPPEPSGNGHVEPPRELALIRSGDIRIEDVADMTLRQIAARYGTALAFRDWLNGLKTLEIVREKNLKNAESDGKVISVELVRTHIMGAIEAQNQRLLTDTPKSMARRLYAAAKSDVPIEEGERIAREMISSQLRALKDSAARVLRGKQG